MRVARLEVEWPTSGTTQVFRDIDADRAIEITELDPAYRSADVAPIRNAPAIAVKIAGPNRVGASDEVGRRRPPFSSFRRGVTCLIDTQFLPQNPAVSPGVFGP